MVWSDFEISQNLIAENGKQRISFNTVCVTNATFQEVACNCSISQQASENSPNEFRSTRGSKDVIIKIFEKQLKIEQLVTFEWPRMWQ